MRSTETKTRDLTYLERKMRASADTDVPSEPRKADELELDERDEEILDRAWAELGGER